MTGSIITDLDEVLDGGADDFRTLAGSHVVVTGGSGFVGTWMLETLLWANSRLALGARATVLTRDPERFVRNHPGVAGNAAVSVVSGDVRDLSSLAVSADAVVHAASPTAGGPGSESPADVFSIIVDGTRAVLDYARECGSVPVLLTSSGAVYGPQPSYAQRMAEYHLGGPDTMLPRSAYHEGKRAAELLSAIATAEGTAPTKIARLFAFVGPHLPLDQQFAAGNFVRDKLNGGPITVKGTGSAVRSYLYASDMAWWLWRILTKGEAGRAYNVGSEETVSIVDLARLIAASDGVECEVTVTGTDAGGPVDRYVPDTSRARAELGLAQRVSVTDGVRRTLAWHRG